MSLPDEPDHDPYATMEQLKADVSPDGGDSQPRAPLQKKPEDTSSGCRGRAEQSLVAAAAMDTSNGRIRMEASAATWTARADLLLRLEQRTQARQSLANDDSESAPERS